MQLVLNEENLRKGWGSASEYWFSRKDYVIRSASELENYERPEDISQSAYFLSLGFIPYFNVSDVEVMRAFVQSNGNPKIIAAFDKVADADYVETFWKYFNAYKEFSDKFDSFETEYVRKKAADWCYENGVNYTFDEETQETD